MKIEEIIAIMEQWAPPVYAEDFDNVGLLVGAAASNCSGVLITHDVNETVVEEAIEKKCNFIVCFHPILFKGLKRITGQDYVQKIILKAIQNNIAIYALHTALDNHPQGVSYHLGQCLGLTHQKTLVPQKNSLYHLTTYVPEKNKEAVLEALHQAGAGQLGHYSQCSFSNPGEGRFKGNIQSQPALGEKEALTSVNEVLIRVLVPKHAQSKIISALHQTHPYETVAYELVALANTNPSIGMGSIGQLPTPMDTAAFIKHVKQAVNIPTLRHSKCSKQKIESVAVLGGSGSFCIDAARKQGADALVTADLKYHDFFKAEKDLLLIDAGHYETEHFTKKIIHQHLTKKIANFAVTLSTVNTNPVIYS